MRIGATEAERADRGLTALDQAVVPVVRPDGFLSSEELALLDAALPPVEKSSEEELDTAGSEQ